MTGREERAQVKYFSRIKRFPNQIVEIMAADRPIFKAPGWEPVERSGSSTVSNKRDTKQNNQDPTGASVVRSIRRARAKVREIALANNFTMFVTLTLDGAKIDRYDPAAIVKKLSTWADNQVRRRGLRYVLVPEHHKDGALHFHGFLSWPDGAGFVDSGTIQAPGAKKPRRPRSQRQRDEWLAAGGHPVYNVPSWPFGFSTAIPVYGDYLAAVNYCCKYIGKEMDAPQGEGQGCDPAALLGGKIGGRWYYSGGKLDKPLVEYADLGVRDVAAMAGGYAFDIAEAGLSMALYRGRQPEGHQSTGDQVRTGLAGETAAELPQGHQSHVGQFHGGGW